MDSKTWDTLVNTYENMRAGDAPEGLSEYLDLVAQVYNGGIAQYVHNGYHYDLSRVMDFLRSIKSTSPLIRSTADLEDIIELYEEQESSGEPDLDVEEEFKDEIERLEDLILDGRLQKEVLRSIQSTVASTGNSYKLRAECKLDVHRLFDQIPVTEYKVKMIGFPDVEAEFKSMLSLKEIREEIRRIPDSHVMLETVTIKKDYTGDRMVTAALYDKREWQHSADVMLQEDLKALRASLKEITAFSKSGPPGPLHQAGSLQQLLRMSADLRDLALQLHTNLDRNCKKGDS